MTSSNSRVTLALLVIWAFTALCAVFGFYLRWEHLPAVGDAIMSVSLLAPFALPKAFSDVLGLTQTGSIDGTVFAALLYWPAVVALHWLAYKKNLFVVWLFLSATLLLSGFNWFVVGTAMMGL